MTDIFDNLSGSHLQSHLNCKASVDSINVWLLLSWMITVGLKPFTML